jgi:hypothetical protein
MSLISNTVASVRRALTRAAPTEAAVAAAVERPELLEICGTRVFRAEALRDYDIVYFYGCANVKTIVAKKGLAEGDFIYAHEKKGEWILSHAGYNRAKLFLREEWVLANVPKMGQAAASAETYMEAPPVLVLEEHEKFTDTDGRKIEIEVCGERTHDGIFFKVKDVSAGFNMPTLDKTIMNTDAGYSKTDHYATFITRTNDNPYSPPTMKHLYLTYKGILRVLFCSRSGNADRFVDWAVRKLFTIQYDVPVAKAALAAELMAGADMKAVRAVTAGSAPLPAIYLFAIGRARALLPESGDTYDPDAVLYKFGRTDNLKRRMQEHAKTYQEMFRAAITLPLFAVVDGEFLAKAEVRVAEHFDAIGARVQHAGQAELVVLTKKQFEYTKGVYGLLPAAYLAKAGALSVELAAAQRDIIETEHRTSMAILMKDNELKLAEKDIYVLRKEIGFLERENRLLTRENESLRGV